MKKRKLKKKFVVFFSLYFVLLISYFTIYTFSKYVGTINKQGNINIAKWDVSILDNEDSTINIVSGNTSENLNQQSYILSVKSASEVSNYYSIILTNVPSGVRVILDDNETYYESNNLILIKNAGSFTANDSDSIHNHKLTFIAPRTSEDISNQKIDLKVTFMQGVFDNYITTEIIGPCTFNGSGANITGENCKVIWDDGTTIDYTNGKYIDTGIYLFNEENKNKDFEISFTVDSINSYTDMDTIVSAMNEAGSPWDGIVFRLASISSYDIKSNKTTASTFKKNYDVVLPTKVVLKRINNIIYLNLNEGEDIYVLDFSDYTGSFDYPITFGAGLNGSKKPQRYFIGTLSNIKVKIEK